MVRWRLADLALWIWDEFALSVTRHTLGRELRALGYRKLSARPRHRGQNPDDIPDFKKLRHPSGANQAAAPERNADRAVVERRGPRWSADQAHPTLDQARHSPLGTQGPAAIIGMAVRGDLSGGRQGCRYRHAPVQLRGDEHTP